MIKNIKKGVYFVSGIDTDIGKTIATGVIARHLLDQGVSVITQKLIQTGNQTMSDDVIMHRRLMQMPLAAADHLGLTMPAVLSYPASPHLAAKMEQVQLDLIKIHQATVCLTQDYEVVLLEGAGGLMVPLVAGGPDGDYLTVDYIKEHNFPVILVTSGRLGSINHTLLSLEMLRQRQIGLYALAYNEYDDSADLIISDDNKRYFKTYLKNHFPDAVWIDIPTLDFHEA